MPNQEENFVGLFIDWDNLAISTAVDFAGAVPDVRAIVKAAQRFGTVLVARAYAEWNVSSERLSVYRAGIEPVYAPTFRFESDSSSTGSRGKSLADPCLVTDCIDTLHLMPEINVFVLVSGDKDLIPIVRLAQLRGKRVVVIGPDYAAAILRDMADEYIPYRQLAEASDNPPTEISVHGVRSQRRAGSPSRASPAIAPATTPALARAPTPTRPPSLTATPNPAPPEPNGAAVHPPETVVEPAPVEEVLDPGPLFATISAILREREQAGKPRLRATNLKDQLIARIPGFNERRYGFARFKDLLAAAEKAGVIVVSRTGPVQWVSSANPSTPASLPATDVASMTPAVEASPTAVSTETTVPDTEAVDASVVEFILGLRERSRWLTYTYVLTNLLNHLGNGAADAASDAEARVTLNRLVQAGVLVVDREPREIDVNGTRHRVRLCHVVDEHPLVQKVLAEMAAARAQAAASEPATEAVAESAESASGPSEPTDGQTSTPSAASAPAVASPPASSEAGEPVVTSTAIAESLPTSTPAPSSGETVSEGAEGEEASVAPPIDTLYLAEESEARNREPVLAEEPDAREAPTARKLTLAESFEVLREVVREATDANHPTTGPAAIKNRLVRRLGSFDEHEFGFSKFKDYLLSAERAGAIRLEVSGTTTRVALANEPAAAPKPAPES